MYVGYKSSKLSFVLLFVGEFYGGRSVECFDYHGIQKWTESTWSNFYGWD